MSSFHTMAKFEQQMAEEEKETRGLYASRDSMKRYENRFERKPWLIRHLPTRQLARLGGYFAQVVSVLAGFYGAKVVMEFIPVPIPYFEYIMAAFCLVLLEILKRRFSDRFWDSVFGARLGFNVRVRWGSGAANIILLFVSLALSVGGMYFAATDFSPDNPEAIALNQKIETAKQDLAAWKKDPANLVSNGQVKWNLRKIPQQKEEAIIALETAYFDQFGTYAPTSDWDIRNAFRKYFAVILTLIAELLFEGCMAFASYYDARKYRARKMMQEKQEEKPKRPNGVKSKKVVALTA